MIEKEVIFVLNNRIANCEKALYIVNFFKKKSIADKNDIVSALNLIESLHEETYVVYEIIHKAYIMCRYMYPDVEDVVSILIYSDIKNNIISKRSCSNSFASLRGNEYYEYSSFNLLEIKGSIERDIPRKKDGSVKYTLDECYEIHIMHRVCDKMYDAIGRKLKRFHDSFTVFDAYTMAREAHYWEKRATGEPYITHPLMVAEILADFGVESPVVAAAILHDVAEDTDISIADIKNKCGGQVSRYVNAVTSLHKEYEQLRSKQREQVDDETPEEKKRIKEKLDKESFEKLVSIVDESRAMVFALYIKAADRIHNLRTMDTMSQSKKGDKVDETEKWYLPLFKRYNLHFFCDIIEDLLWKLGNVHLYNDVSEKYEDMKNRNHAEVKEIIKLVKSFFDDDFNVQCDKRANIPGFDFTVSEHYYSPYEINKYLKKKYGANIDVSNLINKKHLPVCDIDIILDPKDNRSEINSFSNVFIAVCANKMAAKNRVITDFEIDDNNRFIVFIEDDYYNVVRCCFCMRDDYMNYLNGGNGGFNTRDIKSSLPAETKGMITVKLRDGRKVQIKEGATVLDLAFLIHQEIAISATGATINNQPRSISSVLHDEDQVVVISDTYREQGGLTKELVKHAKIEWINYVKTDYARDMLINYLKNEYEGEET